MKIIVIGAGKIGTNLAKSLSEENHEVYLIEKDEDTALKAREKLDAKVVEGSGADPDILKSVQVENADLVISVTTSDEANLVVSSLAATLGAKRRIARVRNTSLSAMVGDNGSKHFGINDIINPELVAAETIVKTIMTPGAREVADFADGKILLRSFDIPESSPLVGSKVQDLSDEDFPWPFVIIGISRDHNALIPTGGTTVQADDRIYVLLPQGSLGEFLSFIDPDIKMPKKVVIFGASLTGMSLAESLAKGIRDVILIEEDEDLAEEAAEDLMKVRVIHGSASESEILREVGVEVADAFISATGNDQSNLVSAALAKKLGAKSTIITAQQPDYESIIDALNVDVVVNPHLQAVKQILHMVRGRIISSVTKLTECESEAIELIPEAGSAITKNAVKDVKFPKDAIIGAICRGEEAIIVRGDTLIQPGDKVIAFSQASCVKKLQKLFTNNSILK